MNIMKALLEKLNIKTGDIKVGYEKHVITVQGNTIINNHITVTPSYKIELSPEVAKSLSSDIIEGRAMIVIKKQIEEYKKQPQFLKLQESVKIGKIVNTSGTAIVSSIDYISGGDEKYINLDVRSLDDLAEKF